MAILVRCPKCTVQLSAPDTAAGKKIRCPRCGEIVPISMPAAPPPLPDDAIMATAAEPAAPRASAIQVPPPVVFDPVEEDEDEPALPRRRRSSSDRYEVRRKIPMTPEDILSPSEYRNYRNIRAIAVLFIILGSCLGLGGITLVFRTNQPGQESTHPVVAILMAVIGVAGAVGGIATIRRSKRWAPLVYIMAAVYLLGFPVGTILSAIMLTGLSKYLRSVELIKRTTQEEEDDEG